MLLQWKYRGILNFSSQDAIPMASYGLHRVSAVYVHGFRLVNSKTNKKYEF
jgi:hypothetical protein